MGRRLRGVDVLSGPSMLTSPLLVAALLTFWPGGPAVGESALVLVDSKVRLHPSREADSGKVLTRGRRIVIERIVSRGGQTWIEFDEGFLEASRLDLVPREEVNATIGRERVATGSPLPAAYEPDDLTPVPDELKLEGFAWRSMHLRRESLAAFDRFVRAAREAGFPVGLISCHRHAEYQAGLYASALRRDPSQQKTAPPGRSEHQLGTTADVGVKGVPTFDAALAETPAGKWIARECERFGLVLTYSEDRCRARGVAHEPWHLRHVGIPLPPEEEW